MGRGRPGEGTPVDRRTWLAAVASVGLAGCSTTPFDGGERTATPTATATQTAGPRPYQSANPEENVSLAHGIGVRNRSAKRQYVTVAVADDGRDVFVASDPIPPGENVSYPEVVAKRGTYRVVVETADGARTVHDWVVSDKWHQHELSVVVTEAGVETHQYAFCTPHCDPIQASGSARSLPVEDATDPGQEVHGVLVLHNRAPEETPTRVVVDGSDRRIIDYTYRFPAGITALVPVARGPGAYDVRLETPNEAFESPWNLPEEPSPRLDVAPDDVVPACSAEPPTCSLGAVKNAAKSRRRVRVTVDVAGETRFDDEFALDASESLVDLASVPRERPFSVDVSLDGTSAATATWTFCPPTELAVLAVDETVYLRTGAERLFSGRAAA